MITPKFNPTNAPESEIYARDRYASGNEWLSNSESLRLFRLEERERVISGLGITAASIVKTDSLGAMGLYNVGRHLQSRFEDRQFHDALSPFVSFSIDPNLIGYMIKDCGWGDDPVVVEARIDPGRALVKQGNPEVLLVGGLSPDEFIVSHEPRQFLGLSA